MLDDSAKQWLRDLFATDVRFDEPLDRYTSLGVGGPAEALAEPRTHNQLKALLQWSANNHIPCTIIGGGTNLLVRDGGIRGVTIRLGRMDVGIRWKEQQQVVALEAASGVPTRRLCALALRRGWQGMNFALGIPGTLGGAVCMNAGSHLGCMADIVRAITLLTWEGRIVRLGRNELDFSYRALRLPGHGGPAGSLASVVLDVELDLAPGDPRNVRQEARAVMRRRAASQPIFQPSAGCFFRNPRADMSAGQLIDQAGMKGAAVGDACVSRRHANFIVNNGHATAADVMALASQVEEAVWRRFKIKLQREVRIVGQDRQTP